MRRLFLRPYLAILSLSPFQSHRSLPGTPHISCWRIPENTIEKREKRREGGIGYVSFRLHKDRNRERDRERERVTKRERERERLRVRERERAREIGRAHV